MARTYLDTGSPIAALATASGRAALAVVRVSGNKAIERCASCFSAGKALTEIPGYRMEYGFVVDPETGEKIDEALAAVFRSPRSFTGEDSVELSCHGSPAVVSRVLGALEKAGFAPALPGEFSFRAFINGKTDLVKAEAVNELSGARCESAREDALRRLGGALSSEYAGIRGDMLDILAEVEARLDYPEDEGPDGEKRWLDRLTACADRLDRLSRSYIAGRLRQEGALVVVAGRPNAGKSSLFNLVVREERAIVSPEPGTTRDWLEAWVEVGGYAVRLIDTAGLRHAEGGVEAEGVRRSRELSDRADILVYMVDGRSGIVAEDEEFAALHPAALRLWNKIDAPDCRPQPQGWLGFSAQKGEGLDLLEDAIVDRLAAAGGSLSLSSGGEEEVRIASARQKTLVDRCSASVRRAIAEALAGAPLDAIAVDVREAAGFLGEITGEFVGDEVFECIFGSFCLGK